MSCRAPEAGPGSDQVPLLGRAGAATAIVRRTIELDRLETRVLVEQLTAGSPDRPGDSVGRLSAGELRDLDAALTLVLGL